MSAWLTLETALEALRRNVMRTALTALGIIIGVAAVIVMMALGNGARASIEVADPHRRDEPDHRHAGVGHRRRASARAGRQNDADAGRCRRDRAARCQASRPCRPARPRARRSCRRWATGPRRFRARAPNCRPSGLVRSSAAASSPTPTSRARPRSRCLGVRRPRPAVRRRRGSDGRDDPHRQPAVHGGRRARRERGSRRSARIRTTPSSCPIRR